jgi:mRNA deadenylase 3'-5' endonuclease subunit Ccr4
MGEVTISKENYKLLIELYAKKFKTKKLGYIMCNECKKVMRAEDFTTKNRHWCIFCKREWHSKYQRGYYVDVSKARRQAKKKEAESESDEEEEEEEKSKKKKSTTKKSK